MDWILDGWRSLRFTWVWVLMVGGLTMTGCSNTAISQSSQPAVMVQATEISKLQDATARNTRVHVKGTVGDRVPLVEGTVYQLQDATGKIWILSKQPPPNTGQEVIVKGTVRYQPISINGKEVGSIYLEQE